MFVRRNKNRSGTYSIQIIQKVDRKNRVVKTLGSSDDAMELDRLESRAKLEIEKLKQQQSLFNIQGLIAKGYEFVLGGRIKNEQEEIKEKIQKLEIEEGHPKEIKKNDYRLIVSYSSKRARKDEFNRKRGLKKLEAKIKKGKLDKNSINNRGYNKYLKLESEVKISIDYKKFENDKKWDGLKGYLTNTRLKPKEVIEAYGNLWHIEKAFRISKTDIRIRPIYHRIPHRIESHICICFVAYAVFKELERKLKEKKIRLSPYRAIELTKNMYQIRIQYPDSKVSEVIPLKLTREQQQLARLLG